MVAAKIIGTKLKRVKDYSLIIKRVIEIVLIETILK
jgi:hypothetical protein